MNKWTARIGMAITLVSLSAGMAVAGPKDKKAPECPVCHMALSKKKTDSSTVAVKLTKKGKTMYCCSGCTMPEDVLVKPKGKKK